MTTTTNLTLPRLLLGIGTEPLTSLDAHTNVYGPLPDLRSLAPTSLIQLAERSGLRGHGGASFPVARKLQAVASRRGSKIVVANGTEGEPASKKDRALMCRVPHLILDGAAVAARAVGAEEAIIAFSENDHEAFSSLEAAMQARTGGRGQDAEPRYLLAGVPDRFVTGQETALVNLLNGGEAKPTFGARPFERGVRRAPTLVQNVETLSHLALIARHGADWFRRLGPAEDPGSALITLSGAVSKPGVYEIEHGMPLPELLHRAGVTEPLRAILLGGYFGSWLPASEIPSLELSPRRLAAFGASFGAGVIVAVGRSACPVAETARIADYLATESAGQCGPCVNGLGAIADTVQQLATGTAGPDARRDLERWTTELPGRGACQYPDGASRFIASGLRVFGEEFRDHARHGACERCSARPVLPAPAAMLR